MKASESALKFVILLGCVSLLADFTYEGARSITGPYLSTLGASATVVGVVAGFGECIGYVLRLLSGYLSDKTGRYWTIAIVGYLINLAAVPLLAVTSSWQAASALIITERIGKAIRTPARDTMISYAGQTLGSGRAFGIHQALDHTGAILGPLLIAIVLWFHAGYALSFSILAVPAVIALSVLVMVRWRYPDPEAFEVAEPVPEAHKLPNVFWIYLTGVAFVAFGFVDFALIAFHFSRTAMLPPVWIALFYSIGMAASALGSYVLGHWFDKHGSAVLIYTTLVSSIAAPLLFFSGFLFALVGMVVWGVGLGGQVTLMSALIAQLVPGGKRGMAYGILYTCFGLAWFAGSALMGYLYDISIGLLALTSLSAQLLSLPLFWLAKNSENKGV